MASVIRPNRTEVSRTFPYLGFTIRTGRPASYEVVLTTKPELLESGAKSLRSTANFASTRALGPLPAPTGEAVWIVPAPMLARFAGQDKLYYAAAVFPNGDLQHPEIVKLASGAAPAVALSRSYTGETRRLAGITAGSGSSSNGAQWGGGASLEWAGDAVPAGTIAPVDAQAPAAQAAMFEYSDGLGPMPVEAPVEEDGPGIEGPIPDEEPMALGLTTIAPEYPQASRFAPAHSGNYRARTAPRTIQRVVIHITDGGANINGTIGWFQNAKAKVSAHYVIGQDGEVVQMVRHNDVAWHASSANGDSIGIEHVANTRGLMPTEAQLCASALLVNWLCQTYGIPCDRLHVLGHAEADPNTTHTGCPNAVWDWNAYMPMVTSGSCTPAESQAVALSQPFDERWEVEPVPQLTDITCWAAAASMVVGWRDLISINPTEIAAGAGPWAKYSAGLRADNRDEFADMWDLAVAPPQSYTVEGFRDLLHNGPLYIAVRVPSGHAVCVYGLSGDGTRDGTFVHYHDPWPPGVGAPDQVKTFEQFMAEYEDYATSDPTGRVNNQILYPKTTGGRTLVSTAQALATPARSLAVVEIASAILGATMTRVLDNEGDVHWELDQLNGLKRPWNDDAHKGQAVYSDKTLKITGPRAYTTALGIDALFADCSLDFQYNGRSVGNIAIGVVNNSDAVAGGLTVKAQIIDDANAYTAPGFTDPFAAVKVRFHYRFDYTAYDDEIAVSTVTLYGNGSHAFKFEWTQR